jgi:hypothetical protein
VAFVNRREQDESAQRAAVGEPIDFDPDDPTIVKVHYDLSAWDFDQRAELAEALADAGLPHAWDAEELIVPELVEDQVDALFERLEESLGPFPIALAPDDESTEFGLDEWSEADRALLTESLVVSEVPHRWEGTTVVVARDAEDAVDDLLDAIEAGELLSADEHAGGGPPDGALDTIFLAADRLVKDPVDARARTALIDIGARIDGDHPPYAFAPRTWARAVDGVTTIVETFRRDVSGTVDRSDDVDGGAVVEQARALRDLLRPFV